MHLLLALIIAALPYSLPLPAVAQSPGAELGHRMMLERMAQGAFGSHCTNTQVQKYGYGGYSLYYSVTSQLEARGFEVGDYGERWYGNQTRVWTALGQRGKQMLLVQVLEYRSYERPWRTVGGVVRGCWLE